ncbi:MAG: hypothetical protein U0931_20285 [Vulcanimicrobiota bacterium]
MSYTRRRFLTDLLFVGGAVAVAAGMAATAEPQKADPKPTPSTCPTDVPMPGQMVANPKPSPTPTSYAKPGEAMPRPKPKPGPATSHPTPGRMVFPRKPGR